MLGIKWNSTIDCQEYCLEKGEIQGTIQTLILGLPDDLHRFQSDMQILYEKIDLSKSHLTSKEKARLMKLIIKYRDAFSLRDEIGACPNLTADIQVIDESPFFVRPFPLSETDKEFMDTQMERLVSLGILSKNSTSHTSPVMLITRKLTNDKRPVVDFRLLNTRILRRNTSIPLMKDVLSILGNSKCEVMSCVDIKDAYHSIPLTKKRVKNIVVFYPTLEAQYISMRCYQWALLVLHKYGWTISP